MSIYKPTCLTLGCPCHEGGECESFKKVEEKFKGDSYRVYMAGYRQGVREMMYWAGKQEGRSMYYLDILKVGEELLAKEK